ncbi:MAG: TonB-dependent receptor [Proteobacteria bacterium]|nr:TonB-dependent receptor [Pseudomonadota bacterium]
MRLDVNKLSSAVRLALTLGTVAAAGSLSAFAQDTGTTTSTNTNQKSQALETIVVTGSNIRRVDIETSNPVITIDSAAIQNTGKLTLGDIVQSLPTAVNGTNPQVNNGGGSGSATVSLRGLGSQRTLILVDGHHVLNRDIDAIPIAAVERIEILTSGASAIYGSDAIGGVVNVILKKNYQGAQFSADYGISDHDDGQRQGYHFIFGQTSDKGSIMAGVDYNKTDSVLQGNRKFSQNAVSLYGNTTSPPASYVGGSSFGANGNIQLPPGAIKTQYGCSRVAHTPGTSGANALTDYHCFVSSDKYNYATVNLLMTPQERTAGFISGTYHLTDSIDVYFNGVHNKTSSGFQLAPALFGSLYGGTVSKDNMYNPFGVDYGPGAYDFRLRLAPAGNRAAKTNNTTDQYSTGFKGVFSLLGQDWNWEAGVDYGHISTVATTLGLPNLNILNQAAGPSMLVNGVPTCVATPGDPTTAIAGCTPFNPFNPYTPDQVALLKTIAAPALTNVYAQEKVQHVGFSGGLFDLPAGTAQLAVGGSYRKEYTNSVVDPVLQINPATGNCTLGSQCSSALQGGYNVKEAYGELFLPVLKDLPFVNSLNVTLSDRWSKYNTFGSTNNYAIGVEWKPIADLLLRANYNKVFRAPQIGDLFGNPVSDAPKLSSDPCTGFTGAAAGTGPALACVGVPTDGSFQNTDVNLGQQIKAVASGSEYAHFPLGPESGSTFNYGFVYSPSWLDGLSVSADIWRVYLINTIVSVGAQAVLNNCYAGQLQYCPLITRFSATSTQPGQIAQILEPTANLGRLDTKGADFSVKYRLPQFSFGQFMVGLDATYLAQYNQNSADTVYHNAGHVLNFGSGAQAACADLGGGVCLFPRWRALGSVNWNLGPWDASWRMRYVGKFRMGSKAPSQDTFPAGTCYYGSYCTLKGYELFYGARTYNDVQVGYNIEQINTRLDVGVDNVGDIQPPFLYANNSLNANTDPGNFDMMGRYYWARVTVKF